MHEFSICESIVKSVQIEYDLLEKPRPKLIKVNVVVGEMHAIVPDNMEMAYELLTKDSDLKGSELVLEFKPVTAICNSCKADIVIELPAFKCKKCGGHDLEMTGGKELYLSKLVVDGDD